MTGAVICGVRIGAAHHGVAEMVVTLRHDNGACSEVTLDESASAALFSGCNATRAEDLQGQGWERVREALCASANRFAPPHQPATQANGNDSRGDGAAPEQPARVKSEEKCDV